MSLRTVARKRSGGTLASRKPDARTHPPRRISSALQANLDDIVIAAAIVNPEAASATRVTAMSVHDRQYEDPLQASSVGDELTANPSVPTDAQCAMT